MSGQIVGYARVSATDQKLDRQIAALGDCDRIFQEKASAGRRTRHARPELEQLIAYVRAGDTVRVKSPDRLARSTVDLLQLIETVKAKGAQIEFVDNPTLNTASPQATFTLTILAAVAELEREVIRERQAEGIALAKAKGVYDRGPKMTPEQVDLARSRIAEGVPKARVARDLGVSRQTLYTALAGEGRYARA